MIKDMRSLELEVVLPGDRHRCMAMQVQSTLVDRIKVSQAGYPKFQKLREQVDVGLRSDLMIHDDGSLCFGSRLCMPGGAIRQELMSEAHSSPYSIHPGGTKMYRDLRQHYWWHEMKRDIARYVSRCLVCQQVKVEHQRTAGLL